MGTITKIISGTGILIALYLVIVKSPQGTVNVINSLGNVYTKSVKTLQGN